MGFRKIMGFSGKHTFGLILHRLPQRVHNPVLCSSKYTQISRKTVAKQPQNSRETVAKTVAKQ